MADMSERERREQAERARDRVVAGSGTAIEGRKLGQVVTLRLEPEVLSDLRDIANERGTTVSDLLREGAAMVISSNSRVMDITKFSAAVSVSSARTTSVVGWSSPTSNPTAAPFEIRLAS
jgi:predicted DNA-binding ribbon-helix-helix protein